METDIFQSLIILFLIDDPCLLSDADSLSEPRVRLRDGVDSFDLPLSHPD
ncbi:MAG: hypothetical protein ACE5PV_02100 [Candidatus Poribacteria bacterium]